MIDARVLGGAVLLALVAAPAETLRFAPAEGSSLVKTFTSESQAEAAQIKITVDGQELPPEVLGEMRLAFQQKQKLVVTDRWVKTAGGRPLELDRTYDELVQTEHNVSKMPGMAEEKVEEKVETSELEGATVRFSWNSTNEAYEAAFAGEERGEELLEELEEDLDFRGFLPSEAVEVGDTWDLEGRAFRAFLSPGGILHFREEGQEEEDDDGGASKQFTENLEGKGKATFENVREKDGRRLARIVIEAQLKSSAEDAGLDAQMELDVEGQILWDLDAKRIDSLELEGDMRATMTSEQQRESGGQEHSVRTAFEMEGKARLELETRSP